MLFSLPTSISIFSTLLRLAGAALMALLLTALPLSATAATPAAGDWTSLLDAKLSQFDKFIGVPHASIKLPGYTHADDPKKSPPLGLNQDPLAIFTVRTVEGEPVLHITGEIFGVLATRATYSNFHLRVQFRWGTTKYAPRLTKQRDNGLLYHCVGPLKVWPTSLECQVQENDIGDLYALGGTRANIASQMIEQPGVARPMPRYTPGAQLNPVAGRGVRGTDYHELPNGEWNIIEIMTVGDRSIYLLNGRVVNVLQDAVQTVDGQTQPLVAGQIAIQSEGAECEYRRVEIRPLAAFPAEYLPLFR